MVDISRARLERSVETNTGVVDSGAAQVYGTLSQRLQEFSNRQMKEYADQRIAQGSKEGAQASAGKLTGPVPEGDTMYNQAFREAAIVGHVAAIKNETVLQVSKILAENPDNLEGFNEQINGWQRGFINGLDPALRPSAIAHIDSSRVMATLKIQEAHRALVMEDSKQQVAWSLENLQKEAESFASIGNIDLAQERQETVFALLDSSQRLGFMSGPAVAKAKADIRESVDYHLIKNQFEAAQARGSQSAVRFIQNLDKNTSIDPEQRNRFVSSLISELNKDEGLAKAAEIKIEDNRKERWDAGEQALTDKLLNGNLTEEDLIYYNRSGMADPTLIRQLRILGSTQGRLMDDSNAIVEYASQDPAKWVTSELLTDSRLTEKTRAKMLEEKRKRDEDVLSWQGTQNASEARRRINGHFGLIAGMPNFDEDRAKAADRKLTQFFETVELLPATERDSKVIEIADSIIGDSQVSRALDAKQAAENRLAEYPFQTEEEVNEAYDKSNKGFGWGGMGDGVRDEHIKNIRDKLKIIEEQERIINGR